MNQDHFCPRHGRASRPVEVAGLLCDCETWDRLRILNDIIGERLRQQQLHGVRSIAGPLPLDTKLRILMEEVGEVAQAIDVVEWMRSQQEAINADFALADATNHLREELVQVAACAVGMLEGLP